MKVTLNIKDNKADFFLELVKSLDFVNGIKDEKKIAKVSS